MHLPNNEEVEKAVRSIFPNSDGKPLNVSSSYSRILILWNNKLQINSNIHGNSS